MNALTDISQALHLVMREDPRATILAKMRKEYKSELQQMVNDFGKRNVQNWLDDTAEDE